MSSIQKTAVLLFANSAKKELHSKSILNSSILFDALNLEALKKVKKTGLPYYHFTENEQVGCSFGARFVNAIQEVYDKGYDNVITIGNDSPQLQTGHIIEAAKQLETGKTVLGPSFDGGFYLLGLQRDRFDLDLFLRLPWQRFNLFRSISLFLEAKSSTIHHLPILQDIDAENDIVSLLNHIHSLSNNVVRLLQKVVAKLSTLVARTTVVYSFLFKSLFYNKGSPSLR